MPSCFLFFLCQPHFLDDVYDLQYTMWFGRKYSLIYVDNNICRVQTRVRKMDNLIITEIAFLFFFKAFLQNFFCGPDSTDSINLKVKYEAFDPSLLSDARGCNRIVIETCPLPGRSVASLNFSSVVSLSCPRYRISLQSRGTPGSVPLCERAHKRGAPWDFTDETARRY